MAGVKAAPLALALLLAACGPRPAATPESRLMLAVTGSQDAQADTRERLPDGLRRRTTWRSRVPMPARELQVTYEAETRVLSWRADLEGSAESLQALAGGPLQRAGTWQGKTLYRITGGPLRGNLAAGAGQNLTLMSDAYAAHYEPQAAALAAAP